MAIAVSGLLAPESDEDGNPVGMLYFCVLAKEKPFTIVREEFGEKPHDQLLGQTLHRALRLIEDSVSPQARTHA